MKRLSLRLDPWNRWLYDYTHPDYHSDRAKDLRERHWRAYQNAPRWMIDEARLNDELRDDIRDERNP